MRESVTAERVPVNSLFMKEGIKVPRRGRVSKRDVLLDPVYNSKLVTRLVNNIMLDGKKGVASKIIYSALESVAEKSGEAAIDVFNKALDNVKPMVEVKSRRVGGSTYQVPTEIREPRREALAMRWIIAAARARSGKSMAEKLANELLDAYNSTGAAFKKKEDTHRMADANKAFTHFRW